MLNTTRNALIAISSHIPECIRSLCEVLKTNFQSYSYQIIQNTLFFEEKNVYYLKYVYLQIKMLKYTYEKL